eukprot:1157669-Pelagomonas_calceolata.AAC.7
MHWLWHRPQGMVLLAVMQPDGHELKDLKAKAQVAHNLGVLPCPSLQGPVRELQAQLPRLTSAHHELLQEPQGDLSLAKVHLGPVSYEGWVIDQGSSRHKFTKKRKVNARLRPRALREGFPTSRLAGASPSLQC